MTKPKDPPIVEKWQVNNLPIGTRAELERVTSFDWWDKHLQDARVMLSQSEKQAYHTLFRQLRSGSGIYRLPILFLCGNACDDPKSPNSLSMDKMIGLFVENSLKLHNELQQYKMNFGELGGMVSQRYVASFTALA